MSNASVGIWMDNFFRKRFLQNPDGPPGHLDCSAVAVLHTILMPRFLGHLTLRRIVFRLLGVIRPRQLYVRLRHQVRSRWIAGQRGQEVGHVALYGGVPGVCPEEDVLQATVLFVGSSKRSHRKQDQQEVF